MLMPIQLDRDQPLQRQLYQQLHELIASARLKPGTRMPSTRMMAEQFAVSRITVLLTYERLIAEGMLETRPAMGTFVCRKPSLAAEPVWHQAKSAVAETGGARCVGQPDPSLFPAARWRSLMRKALARFGAETQIAHPAGSPALRHAIAQWILTSRGAAVSPDQIIVFHGRHEALHFLTHLAVRPGDRVVIENPSDPGTEAILACEGAELLRVAVDGQGMCTDSLPSGAAALIHVTPEHQRPLGVTLAFKRRLALLEWAQQSRAFVLEEDCDGELRYGDLVAVPSLMSLDKSEQVILLGGFAKSLGPWINTAYVALPASLVTEAIELRRLLDDSHVLLEEHALADLLHSGLYARHIHQLSRVYSARRDALVRALDNTFGSRQTIWGGAAGLAVTWFHPADLGPPTSIDARARTLGLEARSVRIAHSQRCALQIGFGHLAEDRLAERVARLASSMQPSALTAMSAD